MHQSNALFPLQVRFINMIGRALRALRVPLAAFDEDALCTIASTETGLTDFGDPYYRAGLTRLLSSAEEDAALHLMGRLAVREMIVNGLANRLRLVATRTHTPALFDQPLIPPIIVLGLPRSGTTLLHRLLALDPAHRAVPLWELMWPLPLATATEQDRARRRALAEQRVARQLALVPELDRKHYVRADTPEECMWLFTPTFVSLTFWVVAPVYGYLAWYTAQDRSQAYQEYAWLLHLLQAVDPTRRLTLKAPAHLGSLPALRQAVPAAVVIQTHRDPVTVCRSLNSLIATTQRIVTERMDLARMVEANIGWLEAEMARNLAARVAQPQGIVDIFYDQLVADPHATVRALYAACGLVWSEAYGAKLQAYMRAHPQGKYGPHQYATARVGPTDAALAERFRSYREQFDLR